MKNGTSRAVNGLESDSWRSWRLGESKQMGIRASRCRGRLPPTPQAATDPVVRWKSEATVNHHAAALRIQVCPSRQGHSGAGISAGRGRPCTRGLATGSDSCPRGRRDLGKPKLRRGDSGTRAGKTELIRFGFLEALGPVRHCSQPVCSCQATHVSGRARSDSLVL